MEKELSSFNILKTIKKIKAALTFLINKESGNSEHKHHVCMKEIKKLLIEQSTICESDDSADD